MSAEDTRNKNTELQNDDEELTLMDAIYDRRSVRQFTEEVIGGELRAELESAVHECIRMGSVEMQVIYSEPAAFLCGKAKHMKFQNAENYIVIYGTPDEKLEELAGYYGEMLVLKIQQMGLNSCWVGSTYDKKIVRQRVPEGKKIVALIAFGHGQNNGYPHGGKFLDEVVRVEDDIDSIPAWFKIGAEAALLAPTARFHQNYLIILRDNKAYLKMTKRTSFGKVDRGILRCHFEMASGHPML